MPDQHVPRFRRAPVPTLKAEPVPPRMKVKLPRDVERKKGWSKTRALKDALKDAFSEAWKAAKKAFAQRFIAVFKEEIDEYVDWNPDDILLKIKLPIRGLRWLTLYKVPLSTLERWVED